MSQTRSSRFARRHALIAAALASSAHAGPLNLWIGASDGLWTDSSRWSLGAAPGSGIADGVDAVIGATGNPYTIRVAGAEPTGFNERTTLRITSADATLFLDNSYMTSGGVYRLQAEQGRIVMDRAILRNNFETSRISVFNGARLDVLGGTPMGFNDAPGAEILGALRIETGGELTVGDNAILRVAYSVDAAGGSGMFTNNGDATFTAIRAIESRTIGNSGTMRFIGRPDADPSGDRTTWLRLPQTSFDEQRLLSNSGTIEVIDADLSILGRYSGTGGSNLSIDQDSSVTIDAGTSSIAGRITNDGTLVLRAQTASPRIEGTGTTVIEAVTLNGATVLQDATFGGASAMTFHDFTYLANATFNAEADFLGHFDATGTITANAALRFRGTTRIDGGLAGNADVAFEDDFVRIRGPIERSAGLIDFNSQDFFGAYADAGSVTLTGTARLTNNGVLDVDNDVFVTNNATLSVAQSIVANGDFEYTSNQAFETPDYIRANSITFRRTNLNLTGYLELTNDESETVFLSCNTFVGGSGAIGEATISGDTAFRWIGLPVTSRTIFDIAVENDALIGDLLAIEGNLELTGSLDVRALSSLDALRPGDSIDLITFTGERTGEYLAFVSPSLSNDLFFTVVYEPSAVRLVVVPTPGAISAFALAGLAAARTARRTSIPH